MSLNSVLDGGALWHVQVGDCIDVLRRLPDECVQTCVTSPPYFGLRNYGVDGQIGLEPTIDEYVARLVEVFREVRRTLRHDATLWLNLGDSYNAARNGGHPGGKRQWRDDRYPVRSGANVRGLKPKDLIGTPWKVAFALRDDGWYLRTDIVWSKSNPMPESVIDRPTRSHEFVFLLSRSRDYYYDAEAIKEPVSGTAHSRGRGVHPKAVAPGLGIKANRSFSAAVRHLVATRNRRTVWTVSVQPVREAHFATFPAKLVEPCILAGTSAGGACSRCGAPRERVLGKRSRAPGAGSGNTRRKIAGKGERARLETHLGSSIPWHPTTAPTVGWRTRCTCDADTVPCLVLDPFSGAGTTGLVARQLERRYIGADLNAEYVALSRRRIARALPSQSAPT